MPLFCGLVPSSNVPLVMVSGPDVEPGLITSDPPVTVSGCPSVPFIEPGLPDPGAPPMWRPPGPVEITGPTSISLSSYRSPFGMDRVSALVLGPPVPPSRVRLS